MQECQPPKNLRSGSTYRNIYCKVTTPISFKLLLFIKLLEINLGMSKIHSPKGYSSFHYYRRLAHYYLTTMPNFLATTFLICLLAVLSLTLIWGKDSNIQPIAVVIVLQIAYSTLAGIVFYIMTTLIPQQTKKLKFNLFVRNSVTHINNLVGDLFKSFATEEEIKNNSSSFYNQNNLKRLSDSVDGKKPLRIVNTVIVYPNPYEATIDTMKSIEEKVERLIGLSDILSIDTIGTLGNLLSACLTIKKVCEFSRQKEFKFLSLNLCEIYMITTILSSQIKQDFKFRKLYHHINLRNRNQPEEKEHFETFF